tara:strand:- start:959 stop:1162 length:204 start_codon:yes stop_codon:yes gene_type:complete
MGLNNAYAASSMGKLILRGQMSRILFSGAYKNGAPGEIRTPDQLVRSQLLYPAELQARGLHFTLYIW